MIGPPHIEHAGSVRPDPDPTRENPQIEDA
jgi:hypothetical protein